MYIFNWNIIIKHIGYDLSSVGVSLSIPFFLSIYTGSLIHEHYTRECEFGNFDKIKNKNNTKNVLKMSPEKQDRHSLAHVHSIDTDPLAILNTH